jgi:oxygen-dependent protoporphyrinogen oxidase
MTRVVVIGGGIAGLASAWAMQREARRIGTSLDILVLERAAEVGGKARSIRFDAGAERTRGGWLVESGPSGFLGGREEMDRLIDEAGLRDQVVAADPAAKRRWVHQRGRTREIAPDPVALAREGVLSPLGAARLVAEAIVPRRRSGGEESVFDFAARRAGREFAERVVQPMALGIFAGDARRLSLESAFPLMGVLEREHGSLVRALAARRRAGVGARELASFRGGMQQLPLALAARGAFAVRCNAPVRALVRLPDAWGAVVEGDPHPILADAVVLAGEPWAMSALVEPHAPGAAADLRAIACPPVAIVALGWGPAVASSLQPGFGVLVSRGEGIRMLGGLRESQLYPQRAPSGHLLLRAIYGGAVDPEAARLGDGELVALAREEVGRLHGITAAPTFTHVVRVPRAIPQYELGHRDRVARIDRAIRALPQLAITGFGLRGVAFADAASDGVRTGIEMARRATSPSFVPV